jgi:hypothetical protein
MEEHKLAKIRQAIPHVRSKITILDGILKIPPPNVISYLSTHLVDTCYCDVLKLVISPPFFHPTPPLSLEASDNEWLFWL